MTTKLAYRIPEALEVIPIGRSRMYEHIRRGDLRVVKDGRITLITAEALADFLAWLEEQSREAS